MLVLVYVAPASAWAQQESAEEARAKAKLNEIRLAIEELSEQLRQSRRGLNAEQQRLREIDLAIQKATRSLKGLEAEQSALQKRIEGLESDKAEYLETLDWRHDELAQVVRSSYQLGRQSRLQLLLNQDDPQELSRLLAYYDFLNQAQLEKISQLQAEVEGLLRLQQEIGKELAELARVQEEQQMLVAELDQQKQIKRQQIEQLQARVRTDEQQLEELQANRKDLETLIERLADALADIPLDIDQQQEISRRKGKLPMPLSGRVLHAYGNNRGGGLKWQGWLIESEPGSEARAIAYGRVAFADWLRGYGLLLIIDHGDGFMSLYGHNEALLHDVGAWVAPGQTISVVGQNPVGEHGLYFGLRKNGKAIDPAAWVSRR